MLNPTSLLADALGRNLAESYRRISGDREPHIASALDEAARLVIECIANQFVPSLERMPPARSVSAGTRFSKCP